MVYEIPNSCDIECRKSKEARLRLDERQRAYSVLVRPPLASDTADIGQPEFNQLLELCARVQKLNTITLSDTAAFSVKLMRTDDICNGIHETYTYMYIY